MTIDEAIAHARAAASEQKRRSGACVTNDNKCDKFSNCMKCAEEHEQLAEWLEELKAYRKIGTVQQCKNSVLDIERAYNNAIDDFADEFISLCVDGEFMSILNELPATTILEIAEQLKEGAKDDRITNN